MSEEQKTFKTQPGASGAGHGNTPQGSDDILDDRPDDNVDQDGHCITPAYGESVGPNTGEPCDDGRANT